MVQIVEPVNEQQRYFEDDKAIVSFVFENDLFAGTDSNYTNGFRAAWLSSEENTPYWARWAANLLPLSNEGHKRIGIAIGQNIYTPRNLNTSALIVDDRPYAGWLYGSVGIVSDKGDRLDNAQLTLGMVGPASGARETQKFVHSTILGDDPQGWDNQLENEFGVILTLERKWRALYEMDVGGFGADITPHIATNLGNIHTDASIGTTVRVGFDLPADYGPPRIRPSLPGSDFFVPTEDLGGYLFAGVEGRAVGRNIFLDGNTFESSHHVDKENFIGSLQAGVAMTWGNNRLSYTHVLMTKEFEEQDRAEQFGSIAYSYRF